MAWPSPSVEGEVQFPKPILQLWSWWLGYWEVVSKEGRCLESAQTKSIHRLVYIRLSYFRHQANPQTLPNSSEPDWKDQYQLEARHQRFASREAGGHWPDFHHHLGLVWVGERSRSWRTRKSSGVSENLQAVPCFFSWDFVVSFLAGHLYRNPSYDYYMWVRSGKDTEPTISSTLLPGSRRANVLMASAANSPMTWRPD